MLAEKKVAHKKKSANKVEEQVESINNSEVVRSNVAQIASKFEEESREFDAQDKNMYIPGEDGKLRLRHASEGYAEVADKKKFEDEQGAKILAQLKKEKEETQKKLNELNEKKKKEQEEKKNSKVNK